jgi:hypothetical protein
MPNYDYTEFPRDAWRERYPRNPEIAGAETWHEFAGGDLRALLRRLQEEPPRQPRIPCVFVSHRRADTPRAQAVAAVGRRERFETWVDVEDPVLAALSQGRANWSMANEAVAIACIIEMALLNCTHVLALLTASSAGSAWIPYEYGRVKDRRGMTTTQAACLLEPGVAMPVAEYFCLGETIVGDPNLSGWLGLERKKWP